MKTPQFLSSAITPVWGIQLFLAYEWAVSGWGKITGGTFVSGMEASLARFSAANPYTWYVDSMLSIAKASPSAFGMAVQWGELLAGIGLIASILLYEFSSSEAVKQLARGTAFAALIGGIFMNLNFFFAAGWTSPSTKGLNVLMTGVQIMLILAWTQRGRILSKNVSPSR